MMVVFAPSPLLPVAALPTYKYHPAVHLETLLSEIATHVGVPAPLSPHKATELPRLMAWLRAKAKSPISLLDRVLRRFDSMVDTKLGMAMAAKIPAKATTTINSISE